MYKVFAQQVELKLVASKRVKEGKKVDFICDDRVPDWTIIKAAIKKKGTGVLLFSCEQPKKCWRNLKHRFRVMHAAGGLVVNPKGEVLMIKRLGMWDLPKGKIEKGEDVVDCAIREVEEECAVYGLGITGKICVTQHVMRRNNNKYLKDSHWYMMKTEQVTEGVPQEEEGIEKVRWVAPREVRKKLRKSWPSIKEVFKQSGLSY